MTALAIQAAALPAVLTFLVRLGSRGGLLVEYQQPSSSSSSSGALSGKVAIVLRQSSLDSFLSAEFRRGTTVTPLHSTLCMAAIIFFASWFRCYLALSGARLFYRGFMARWVTASRTVSGALLFAAFAATHLVVTRAKAQLLGHMDATCKRLLTAFAAERGFANPYYHHHTRDHRDRAGAGATASMLHEAVRDLTRNTMIAMENAGWVAGAMLASSALLRSLKTVPFAFDWYFIETVMRRFDWRPVAMHALRVLGHTGVAAVSPLFVPAAAARSPSGASSAWHLSNGPDAKTSRWYSLIAEALRQWRALANCTPAEHEAIAAHILSKSNLHINIYDPVTAEPEVCSSSRKSSGGRRSGGSTSSNRHRRRASTSSNDSTAAADAAASSSSSPQPQQQPPTPPHQTSPFQILTSTPNDLARSWYVFAASAVASADAVNFPAGEQPLLQWLSLLQSAVSVFSSVSAAARAAGRLGLLYAAPPCVTVSEREDAPIEDINALGHVSLVAQESKLVGKVVVAAPPSETGLQPLHFIAVDSLPTSVTSSRESSPVTDREPDQPQSPTAPSSTTQAPAPTTTTTTTMPFHMFPGAGLLVAAETDLIAATFVRAFAASLKSATAPSASASASSPSVEILSCDPLVIPGMCLADQLTFPRRFRDLETVGQYQLYQLLEAAGLQALVEDDPDTNWAAPVCSAAASADVRARCDMRLSLQQRQQLALARVLFRKPRFVVLSDVLFPDSESMRPTAALLKKAMAALKEAGITVVTVLTAAALADWTTRCTVMSAHYSGLFLKGIISSCPTGGDDDEAAAEAAAEAAEADARTLLTDGCTSAFGILQNPPPAAAPISIQLDASTSSATATSSSPGSFLAFSRVLNRTA